MEIYQSEEQQVEAIKGFWKENGSAIIGGFAVGLAGFVGYNYYQDAKLASEIEASQSFEKVLEVADKDNAALKDAGDKFIAANSDSSYSALAALALAKDASVKEDWAVAAEYLTTAVANAPSEEIKALANLRLARVQAQQSSFDAALTTLATPMPKAFLAMIEETKGDIYVLQGKKELARNAYQAALDEQGTEASPALQIKLDDLAVVENLSK